MDANVSGNLNITTAMNNVSTTNSRTCYIIIFSGCPVIWASKLQSQINLPPTEAEYITLSQSLRDVIPITNLLNELKSRIFNIVSTTPTILCTSFEDNNGTPKIAKVPKMRAHMNTHKIGLSFF